MDYLVAVPPRPKPRVVMAEGQVMHRAQQVSGLHREDVRAAALERSLLAVLQPQLAAVLLAVVAAIKEDVDAGASASPPHVPRGHVDVVRNGCGGSGAVMATRCGFDHIPQA